jgi:integrase
MKGPSMASAGKRNAPSGRVKVWWRLDDGSQGSQTFDDDDQATRYLNKLRAQWDDGTWINPQRGRISFNGWADEWWETWSTHPRRSPNGLETTESNLRLHLRPTFGPKQLNVISHQLVQRWQNQLEGKLGHSGVMACRSLLNRILQAAHDDNRIPNNPVRKVPPPKRSVDPEKRFRRAKRRTFTPEEFGRFLAGCLPFYWDHFVTQVGTGLRPSELLGLRVYRIRRDLGHLEVLEVRYEAGRFGSGYKLWPKSNASVRPVPISDLIGEAIDRRLARATDPHALAFPGPGGNRHARRGTGGGLSTGNYRRVYKAAVAEANRHNDPADCFDHLELRGPHDLRHTFATWLEDAGIPSRVIDELMGHEGGRMERGISPMGALYRETTPEMLARATAAIDDRLAVVLKIAARLLPEVEERRRARQARRDA